MSDKDSTVFNRRGKIIGTRIKIKIILLVIITLTFFTSCWENPLYPFTKNPHYDFYGTWIDARDYYNNGYKSFYSISKDRIDNSDEPEEYGGTIISWQEIDTGSSLYPSGYILFVILDRDDDERFFYIYLHNNKKRLILDLVSHDASDLSNYESQMRYCFKKI